MLYNTVSCEQRENCKYNTNGHCHSIPYNIVLKSINKLKTKTNDGYEGLTSDISAMEHRYCMNVFLFNSFFYWKKIQQKN